MPGTKRKRLVFTPPKAGIASIYASKNYSTLPTAVAELRNGHILHLWNANSRNSRAVKENIERSYGVEGISSIYSIERVVNKLKRFKKLSETREFELFKQECSENFEIKTVTPKKDTSVSVAKPSATPSSSCLDSRPTTPRKDTSVAEPSASATPSSSGLNPRPPVEHSPVKTRRPCLSCRRLRKSLRKCLKEKDDLKRTCMQRVKRRKYVRNTGSDDKGEQDYSHLPPKRLRETLKRRDRTIAKLCNTSNIPDQQDELLVNQKKENKRLNKQLTKQNAELKQLSLELAQSRKKHVDDVRELETSYQHKLLELEDELVTLKVSDGDKGLSVASFSKDGKMYGYQMRVIVYKCLDANVPTRNIPGLIDSIAEILGVSVSSIPCRSTVESMAIELGVISDLQASLLLYETENTTIGFDATTQDGCHVNEIHATTKDKCLVLSLDELAGGTAKDYADHMISTVEHLAQTYCQFSESGQSVKVVSETMISHIKCTLTDRAAANHVAICIVNQDLGTTLWELNCHLHPLDTIATKCKTALKVFEKDMVKSKLFSGVCRAERVILSLNKMRFKDGKGDPHGFRVFLDDRHLPQSLITRYRGNRLHVLFRLAGTYTTYHDEIQDYLENHCLNNTDLKNGLIEEFHNPLTTLQLQVLAITGQTLTRPWMQKFYRDAKEQLHHLDAFELIKNCSTRIERLASQEIVTLEDLQTDFFGDAIEHNDVKIWTVDNVTDFSNMFKAVLESTTAVLKKQFQKYYDFEVTEEMRDATSSSRTHNMDSEEVMGMFSAGLSRAPRATLLYLSSKIRSKKNQTTKFLLSHPKAEKIVKTSVKAAIKLRKRAQKSAADLKKELSSRVAIKMQQKDTGKRKRTEKLVESVLKDKTENITEKFAEIFPQADSDTLEGLVEIVDGTVVKRFVVHNWAIEDEETGKYEIEKYNGKIEKLKGCVYTVCYWGKDQDYDSDGEDTKLRINQMAVDFLNGDLQFLP